MSKVTKGGFKLVAGQVMKTSKGEVTVPDQIEADGAAFKAVSELYNACTVVENAHYNFSQIDGEIMSMVAKLKDKIEEKYPSGDASEVS